MLDGTPTGGPSDSPRPAKTVRGRRLRKSHEAAVLLTANPDDVRAVAFAFHRSPSAGYGPVADQGRSRRVMAAQPGIELDGDSGQGAGVEAADVQLR